MAAKRVVMAGGPAESPVWAGILKSMLGKEIAIPDCGVYAGALGAALLARSQGRKT